MAATKSQNVENNIKKLDTNTVVVYDVATPYNLSGKQCRQGSSSSSDISAGQCFPPQSCTLSYRGMTTSLDTTASLWTITTANIQENLLKEHLYCFSAEHLYINLRRSRDVFVPLFVRSFVTFYSFSSLWASVTLCTYVCMYV